MCVFLCTVDVWNMEALFEELIFHSKKSFPSHNWVFPLADLNDWPRHEIGGLLLY